MHRRPRRPDPDALLRRVQDEEARARRGRLKIFLGACPRRREDLRDAGGGASPAGRGPRRGGRRRGDPRPGRDRGACSRGWRLLPRRPVEYRGTRLQEFDLDAALAGVRRCSWWTSWRTPTRPGSRHAKRWQDVEELLAAGIDVYTTLNVQHLESLNDVVAQITGVQVRETVPDSVLERADEVELVDVTADVLQQRLREGKVYLPEQAARAIDRFFRKGNLIALRELALRRTAERVDAQMRGYRRSRGSGRPGPPTERLLVVRRARARTPPAGARRARAWPRACTPTGSRLTWRRPRPSALGPASGRTCSGRSSSPSSSAGGP